MNYEEAVSYIENTPRFFKGGGRNKSGNENLRDVMVLLGNPQAGRDCIHVAGTNGKGSTTSFIACILAQLGYTVGVFTSPHLILTNERITTVRTDIDGNQITDMISNEDFLECFDEVQTAVEKNVAAGGGHLSYFEMLFAIAAVYYAKTLPDYVIYETGLGGRLDATNIVSPIATAICSIGLDHVAYLGNTIPEIAKEKAGIIKKGTPIIYNTGSEEADRVIENVAAEMSARAINVAKTKYIINDLTDKGIDFSVHNSYYSYYDISIPVAGATYQIDNAMTAITLCNCVAGKLLGKSDKPDVIIPESVIKRALANFSWPGRMERIHKNVILDGAHNANAIHRFVESVNGAFRQRKKVLLFAVADDKDYEQMIDELTDSLDYDRIYVTAIASLRATAAGEIAELFRAALARHSKNSEIYCEEDIEQAFKAGFEYVKGTDMIMFCVGSLYLVGSTTRLAREVM